IAFRPLCRTCHRPTLPGLQACLDSSNPDGSTTLCTPAHCAIAGCEGEVYASRLCERDFHLWREFSPARKEALAGDREALLKEFLAWREKRHAESPQEVNLRETLEEVLGLVEAQESSYGDIVHAQGGPCALCL